MPKLALPDLADLLSGLFTAAHLRRFMQRLAPDQALVDALPGDPVAHVDLMHKAADVLIRYGWDGTELIEALKKEFPRRRSDIDAAIDRCRSPDYRASPLQAQDSTNENSRETPGASQASIWTSYATTDVGPQTHDLGTVSSRAAHLGTATWALLACGLAATLGLLGAQDHVAWRSLLALLGTSPATLDALPSLGVLLVPSAQRGQRNDRQAMAEALAACAARGPAWIALDVPYDLRETGDEPLWNEVLSTRVRILVGVSGPRAPTSAPDSAHPGFVLAPGRMGSAVALQHVQLTHLAPEGSKGEPIADMTLAIAALLRQAAAASEPIEVHERRTVAEKMVYEMPDITLSGALAPEHMRCATWSRDVAATELVCAPGHGVILSFADWDVVGLEGHRDLHSTWIVGPVPRQDASGARCVPDGLAAGQLPGPVYLGALSLTLAAGQPYRPLGEALGELWSQALTRPAAVPLEDPILILPRSVSGAPPFLGMVVYMGLLLFVSPLGYARRASQPCGLWARGLPFAVHTGMTLVALVLLRVLLPVVTGLIFIIILAAWPGDGLPLQRPSATARRE